MKTALITGITGQDGSYLADFLVEKGYKVFGVVRRTSSENLWRVHHLHDKIELVFGDLLDQNSLINAIQHSEPDEVYNLAAQSFVPTSWNQPVLTGEFTALGVTKVLEAIRVVNPKIRFYQASSSEMFGKVREIPQTEETPFHPRSPYAAAKAYAFFIAQNYREAYGMYVCNGILFNHESERRGETFVTRKITRAAGRIKHGLQDKLFLGNLSAKRDWGHARDFVEGMWLMLQQDGPDDYVLGTGETHSVQEFLDKAFEHAELDPAEHVEIDPRYFRAAEVDLLLADASKARDELGWQPKISFEQLVRRMVDHDMELAAREKRARG